MKEHLIKSAGDLKKVNQSTAEEYHYQSDVLTTRINSLMLARKDLVKLIGENNVEMMKDNHANHVRFMASILANPNPIVLVETILWVFRAYRSHGFTTNYWAAQLNAWFVVIKELLTPESFSEVNAYYEWMQVNIPLFVKVSNDDISIPNSLH